jgi:hypothetical protein
MKIARHREFIDHLEAAYTMAMKEVDHTELTNTQHVEWLTTERLIATALKYAYQLRPNALTGYSL